MASPGGAGLGLVAGVAALAAGGVAVGLELERRIVNKRIERSAEKDDEQFFGLRSAGPDVDHPGRRRAAHRDRRGRIEDLTIVFVHGYALSLDCWHFQRKHFRGERAPAGAVRPALARALRALGAGALPDPPTR